VLSGNSLLTLRDINKCEFLNHLDVSNNILADLAHVSNRSLTTLLAADNAIESLQDMQYLPKLRHLDLSRNQVASLQGIEQQTLLSVLNLQGNVIDGLNELRRLAHLTELRELDLRGNPLAINTRDYTHKVLFILPRLLVLNGEAVTAEMVVQAASFHGVDESMKAAIRRRYLPKGDDTLPSDAAPHAAASPEYLPGMQEDTVQGYTRPKLQKGQLEEEAFWVLMGEKCMVSEWESLLAKLWENKGTVLAMEQANLGEVGLWAMAQAVRDNPSISEVRLSEATFPGRWTSGLSRLYGLEALAQAFAMSQLTTLRLERCAVGSAASSLLAEIIRTCPLLTTLSLAHNELGVNVMDGSVVLHQAPSLVTLLKAVMGSGVTNLDLSDNEIDANGAAVLAKALASSDLPVKVLDLSDNPFNEGKTRAGTMERGGEAIAEALRDNNTVERLTWRGGTYRLNSRTVVSIAKSMAKYNDAIVHLDVSGNDCGDQGAVMLARALDRDLRFRTSSSRLQSLVVADCGIGSEGMSALAGSVARNATLTALDLSKNGAAGDVSVGDLFAALSTNTTVRSLSLAEVLVGEASCAALATLLTNNKTITDLRFGPSLRFAEVPPDITSSTKQALLTAIEFFISKRKQLVRLEAGGLGAKWAGDFISALATPTGGVHGLATLYLGSVAWTEESWAALCQLLKGNRYITALSLAFGRLPQGKEHASMTRLLEVLEVTGMVTALELKGMQLTEDGVEALADGLTRGKCLTSLDLASCSLGALDVSSSAADRPGVNGLIIAIATHRSLKNLNLEDNGLGESLLMRLSECLRANVTLEYLTLARNRLDFSDEACVAMASLISASTSIVNLVLPDVDLGELAEMRASPMPTSRRPTNPATRAQTAVTTLAAGTIASTTSSSDRSCPATMGMKCEFDGESGLCVHCGELPDEYVPTNTCSATMGVVCNYSNGFCTVCKEKAPKVKPVTPLCPATMGMTCEYDASGVCESCGQDKHAKEQSTCPASLGASHEYVDGVCQHCGEMAPTLTRAVTVEALPLCPATMGETCDYFEGLCKMCGSSVTQQDFAIYLNEESGGEEGGGEGEGPREESGEVDIMTVHEGVITRLELQQSKDLLLEVIGPALAQAHPCLTRLDLGAGFATGTSAQQKKVILHSLTDNSSGGRLQTLLAGGHVLQDERYPPDSGTDAGGVVDDILANALSAWLCTNRVSRPTAGQRIRRASK
jgi:Ran GTPase-activating protein (RanGAP) involved in mRNA processing and transport